MAQRAKTGSTQSSAASMSSAAISTGGGVVYGTGGVSAATASAQPSCKSNLLPRHAGPLLGGGGGGEGGYCPDIFSVRPGSSIHI